MSTYNEVNQTASGANQTYPEYFKQCAAETTQEIVDFAHELQHECIPTINVKSSWKDSITLIKKSIHVPWMPCLHNPGWLTRYIIGPYDKEWLECLYGDITSGITVGLILIPQGLAYGLLAGLPAINGLYAAIIPSFAYVVLGSSMQLAVGPVAVVSLLTGEIVSKYQTLSSSSAGYVEECLDITAQACICVGVILTIMGILNLGKLIHFISHPVMSAFTTAAAFTIGLSQLPDAVGLQAGKSFRKVPKIGQHGYEYNYQVMAWYTDIWYKPLEESDLYGQLESTSSTYATDLETQQKKAKYMIGWSRFNPYSQRIFVGVYVPLILIQLLKERLKETPERKKSYWFNIFKLVTPLCAFISIIIAGNCVYKLVQDPALYPTTENAIQFMTYMQNNIAVVKKVVAGTGLHFGRIPTFRHAWGEFFIDVLPLTFVLFMESYSVARRIAAQRNQLHILNASQEMFANGIANLLGSVASAYPVAGSFSRSSLIANLGAKTPLAKFICMCVVLIAIGALGGTFYYIPKAALSAVIFVAIYGLISITDFWEAWKHSKKDFLVMIITFTFVFVFETGIGLAIGLGCSAAIYLYDMAFANSRAPYLTISQRDNNGIDVVKIDSELAFLTIERLKDFVTALTKQEAKAPPETACTQDKIFFKITNTLDKVVTLHYEPGVAVMPKAVILDLSSCTLADLTGVQGILELSFELKVKGVLFAVINANADIASRLKKFGVVNSKSTPECDLDHYLQYANSADEMDFLTKGTSADIEHVVLAKASYDPEDVARSHSFDPDEVGFRRRL